MMANAKPSIAARLLISCRAHRTMLMLPHEILAHVTVSSQLKSIILTHTQQYRFAQQLPSACQIASRTHLWCGALESHGISDTDLSAKCSLQD